ncbi:putative S-acyltransferase, partial [Trifolium pratense]
TFKWQEYMDWQRKLKEAQVSAAALRQSVSGINSEKKQPSSSSKWRAFFRRSPLEDVVVVKNNVYNKAEYAQNMRFLLAIEGLGGWLVAHNFEWVCLYSSSDYPINHCESQRHDINYVERVQD